MIIDDMMEFISVEICMEKQKNLIVSCVSRTTGSSMEIFNNSLESMFATTNQKLMFTCGDFNVDMLRGNKNKMADELIETMFSITLYPLIIKRSRVTVQCATSIDNIFTNHMGNTLKSGLLMTDISDHLPVLVIYDCV